MKTRRDEIFIPVFLFSGYRQPLPLLAQGYRNRYRRVGASVRL